MKIIIIMALIIYLFFGIIFAFFPLLSLTKKSNNKLAKENKKSIETMKSSASPISKAKAFVSLMRTSYVLVHIMGNHKGDFDYYKNAQHFCNSLSHAVISQINYLDGVH